MNRLSLLRAGAIGMAAIAAATVWADSPVTSTPFADAYLDYRAVRVARRTGNMTNQIAAYLADASRAIDVKAAVINALSWDIEGKQNARTYCRLTYRKSLEQIELESLRGDELLVLGYLVLMDDYTRPEEAVPILARARRELPGSYTVAMIHAIAEAQSRLLDGGDGAWELIEAVTEDDTLNGDMRVGAMRIIVGYMSLYDDTE